MRRAFTAAAVAAGLVLSGAGCSSDSGGGKADAGVKADQGVKADGPVKGDQGVAPDGAGKGDAAPKNDGGAADAAPKADAAPPPGKSFVFSNLLLPANVAAAAAYGRDMNGDKKPDNKIGGLIGLVAGLNKSLLDQVALAVARGDVVVLMRVEAKSFVTEPAATGKVWLGKKTKCCTSTNDLTKCKAEAAKSCFGGKWTFSIDTKASPKPSVLKGKIAASKLDLGPGKLLLNVTFSSYGTLPLSISSAVVRGTYDAKTGTITSGVFNGAITATDLDKTLLPGLANIVNKIWKDPKTSAATKALIAGLDTDKSGTISGSEIKNFFLLKTYFDPDVDLDKDKKKDAVSVGFGFQAVGAVIK